MRDQLYPDGRIPGDSVPQLSSVVLVDRSVDLLTPLFTQLTLEGLVDQLYGIENGEAEGRGGEGRCGCVFCFKSLSSFMFTFKAIEWDTLTHTLCACVCVCVCVCLCDSGLAVFPAETFSDEVKKTLGNLYNEQRGECKIRLSGKDDLYIRLRDLHIQEIGPFVKRELAELQEYFHVRRGGG